MFLIRTFFWVSLVILLLPVGGKGDANLVGATKYAFRDLDKFCERNVDICNISSEAWRSLKFKAAYGFDVIASMAKEIKENSTAEYQPEYDRSTDSIKGESNSWRTGSLNPEKHSSIKATKLSGQNTLTSNDMTPKWSLSSQQASLSPSS